MHNNDITIVGAGSAGLTLALLLAATGLKITVLEQGNAPSQQLVQHQRVSALNLASMRLLDHVGAWPAIAATAAAYHQMQVWDADSFGRIEFSAGQERLSQLGWICDNEQIRVALYQQLQQHSNVELLFNCTINSMAQSERDVVININQQQLLLSRLIVGADGVNSLVRRETQLPLTHWDYEQQAIVATISTELPHNNTARQVFLPTGPLALLPMSEGRSSLVWCHAKHEKQQVDSWDDARFVAQLQQAFGWRLGKILHAGKRHSYPLQLLTASRHISHRLALVGNAAQTLHPIAGQGFNLGLRDVMSLAETIAQAGGDPGDYAVLSQYQQRRHQ